ncbi:uncharacterized protein LOC120420244 [Culex pipiens pallens]|uniref:uncharacterized protein LOC120420244 n=1 Tax=Culex pipiens pallens TaxID=42434 RepID=UPI0022AAAD22|nr:uncharacterized protein LOC120420244 [Culex pipiens pallens]
MEQTINDLPPEILETIFEYLPAAQLLRIRLVCRHWRDVVISDSKLMGKLILKFPQNITITKKYTPKHLPAAATKVCFESVKIVGIPTWWSSFALNLTHLKIQFSETSLPTLLEMLRSTPNLKRLKLFCVKLTKLADEPPNFTLNKLEKLYLNSICETKILRLFGPMCPNLKDFYLFMRAENPNHDARCVIQFVQTVEKTLESLELYTTKNFLAELSTFKELKLKRLVYNWVEEPEEELVQFCRTQPLIEKLVTAQSCLSNSALTEIGRSLPNLKHLSSRFKPDCSKHATFINAMPNLEHLSLINNYSEVNFGGCQSPNLKHLYLGYMRPTRNSLQQYLKACPNLNSLEMDRCTFTSWDEIFIPAGSLKFLQTLELGTLDLANVTDATFGKMTNLRRLRLIGFKMANPVMAALFRACDQLRLEELNGWKLDEEEALKFAMQEDREWRTMTLGVPRVCGVEESVGDCGTVSQEARGTSREEGGWGVFGRVRGFFEKMFYN